MTEESLVKWVTIEEVGDKRKRTYFLPKGVGIQGLWQEVNPRIEATRMRSLDGELHVTEVRGSKGVSLEPQSSEVLVLTGGP